MIEDKICKKTCFNYVKMLCENHRPQESSQVQILDGHQEQKVLEISSRG